MNKAVKKLAVFVVNRVLRGYIEEFDEEQLNTDFWNGRVKLENVKISKDALIAHKVPFAVNHGRLGEIDISFPWGNLDKQNCVAKLKNCFIHASVYVDALPVTEIDDKPDLPTIPGEARGSALEWFFNVDQIIDNIELTMENVHIRVDVGSDYAFGIKLRAIRTFPVDEFNDKTFIRDAPELVRRKLILDGLSLYFDKNPMQVTAETFDEAMGMDVEHQYLLNPWSFEGNLERHKGEGEIPFRNKVIVNTSDLRLSVDRHQFLGVIELGKEVQMFNKRRIYAPFGRPNRYPKSQRSSGLWWRFVQNCAHANQKKSFSPEAAVEMLRNREKYYHMWLQIIRGEVTQSELLDLEEGYDPVVAVGLRTYSSARYFYRDATVTTGLTEEDMVELQGISRKRGGTGRNYAEIKLQSIALELMNEDRQLVTDFQIIEPFVSADKDGFDLGLDLQVKMVRANNRFNGKQEPVIEIASSQEWPISMKYCSKNMDMKYSYQIGICVPLVQAVLDFEWIASIVEFTKHKRTLVVAAEQPNEAANMLLIKSIIDAHPSIGLDLRVQGVHVRVPYLEVPSCPELELSSGIITLKCNPNCSFDCNDYSTLYETYNLCVSQVQCALLKREMLSPFDLDINFSIAIAASDLFPVSKTSILCHKVAMNVTMMQLLTLKEMMSYIVDTFPESLENEIKKLDESFVPETLLNVRFDNIELGLWHEDIHFFNINLSGGSSADISSKGVNHTIACIFERLLFTEFISGQENVVIDAVFGDGQPIVGTITDGDIDIAIQIANGKLVVRPKPFNYIYVLTKKLSTYAARLKLDSPFDYATIQHKSTRKKRESEAKVSLSFHIQDAQLDGIPDGTDVPVIEFQTHDVRALVDIDSGTLLLNLVLGHPIATSPQFPKLDVVASYQYSEPLQVTITKSTIDVVLKQLSAKLTPNIIVHIVSIVKTITNGHGHGHAPPDFPYMHFNIELYDSAVMICPGEISSDHVNLHIKGLRFSTEVIPYKHTLTISGIDIRTSTSPVAHLCDVSVGLNLTAIMIPISRVVKFNDLAEHHGIETMIKDTQLFLAQEHPLDLLSSLDFWIVGISLDINGQLIEVVGSQNLLNLAIAMLRDVPLAKPVVHKKEVPMTFLLSASVDSLSASYQLKDSSMFQINGKVSAKLSDFLMVTGTDIKLSMVCGEPAVVVPLSTPFAVSWKQDRRTKKQSITANVVNVDFSVETIVFVRHVYEEISSLLDANQSDVKDREKQKVDIALSLYQQLVTYDVSIRELVISFASAQRPMVLLGLKNIKLAMVNNRNIAFSMQWYLGYSNLVSKGWVDLIEPTDMSCTINPDQKPALELVIPKFTVNIYETFIRDILAFERNLTAALEQGVEPLEFSIWIVNERIDDIQVDIDGKMENMVHLSKRGIPHDVSSFFVVIATGKELIRVRINLSELVYEYYPIPECCIYMTSDGGQRFIHVSTPYALKNNSCDALCVSCSDMELGIVAPNDSLRLPYVAEQIFSIRIGQIDGDLSSPVMISTTVQQAKVISVGGHSYCIHNEIDVKRTQMNIIIEDMITVQNLLPIPITISYQMPSCKTGNLLPMDAAEKLSIAGLGERDTVLMWCVLFGDMINLHYSALNLRTEGTQRMVLNKAAHIAVMVSNEYDSFTKKSNIFIYAPCIMVNKSLFPLLIGERRKKGNFLWQDFSPVGGESVLVYKYPKNAKNLHVQVTTPDWVDFSPSQSPVLDCLKIGLTQTLNIPLKGTLLHVPIVAKVSRAPYPYEFSTLVVFYCSTTVVNKLDTVFDVSVADLRRAGVVTIPPHESVPLTYGNTSQKCDIVVPGFERLKDIPLDHPYQAIFRLQSSSGTPDMMIEVKLTRHELVSALTIDRARLPSPITLANVTSTTLSAYQRRKALAMTVQPFSTSMFACESPDLIGQSLVISTDKADIEISFSSDTRRQRLRNTNYWYEVKTIRYGYQMVIISESEPETDDSIPLTFSVKISRLSGSLIDRNLREMLLLSAHDITIRHTQRKGDMHSLFSIRSIEVDDLFSGAVLPVVLQSDKYSTFLQVEATSAIGAHQLRSFQKILVSIAPLTLNVDLALVSDMITYAQTLQGEPEPQKMLSPDLDWEEKEDSVIAMDKYFSVGELVVERLGVIVTLRGRTKRINTLPMPKGVPMSMIRFIPNMSNNELNIQGCNLFGIRANFNKLVWLVLGQLAFNFRTEIWKSIGSIDLLGNPRLLYKSVRNFVANPSAEAVGETVKQVKKGAELFCRSIADITRGLTEQPALAPTGGGLGGLLKRRIGKVAAKISEVTSKKADEMEEKSVKDKPKTMRVARVFPFGMPLDDDRLARIQYDVQISAKGPQKPRFTEKLLISTMPQGTSRMLCCFDHYIVIYDLEKGVTLYTVPYSSIDRIVIVDKVRIIMKCLGIPEATFLCKSAEDAEKVNRVITSRKNSQKVTLAEPVTGHDLGV